MAKKAKTKSKDKKTGEGDVKNSTHKKHKTKLLAIEKRLKRVHKELDAIERELAAGGPGESRLVSADWDERAKHSALLREERVASLPSRRFYRNFVLRCQKCSNKFERVIAAQSHEERVFCPKCGRDHMVGVHPASRVHHIRVPDSLKIVKDIKR